VVLLAAIAAGAGLAVLQGPASSSSPALPTAQAASARSTPDPAAAPAPVPAPPAATPAPPAATPAPLQVNRTLPASSTPTIALTFDDGPSTQWTPAVLDVLARHGVTATFCIVGNQVAGREALLARVVAEGHVVCNHTENHDYGLPVRPAPQIRAEIAAATARIEAAGGTVGIFRAPAGRFEPSVVAAAQAQGLTSWGWSVDPTDWRVRDPQAIVTAVLDGVSPGAVVVLHDGGGDQSATVAAVEILIPLLQSVGYTFVGLPQ
jgi:peptidoglycan/xylan/chitin deacetylase (PgdA/CDA1 family)